MSTSWLLNLFDGNSKYVNITLIVLAIFIIWRLVKSIFKYERNTGSSKWVALLKFALQFSRKDLVKYCDDHERMFQEAKKTGDHSKVTAHFYDLMGPVIEAYYGPSWHFAAPKSRKQERIEAVRQLHNLIARLLQLAPGKKALDIGAGVGGMIHDLAHYSGADITGLALSAEEIDLGNRLFRKAGLDNFCRLVQGNAQEMKPFGPNHFDAVYAVYSLKYFTTLDKIFNQVNRVLKPGGYFLIYDVIKTPKYDRNNPEHFKIVADFEYSCGMPSLHTQPEMVDDAVKAGFECLTQMETSRDIPWYYEFDQAALRWALTSNIVQFLIAVGEALFILPKGFRRFYNIFIAGNTMGIIWGGEKGILTGATVLVFQKK